MFHVTSKSLGIVDGTNNCTVGMDDAVSLIRITRSFLSEPIRPSVTSLPARDRPRVAFSANDTLTHDNPTDPSQRMQSYVWKALHGKRLRFLPPGVPARVTNPHRFRAQMDLLAHVARCYCYVVDETTFAMVCVDKILPDVIRRTARTVCYTL